MWGNLIQAAQFQRLLSQSPNGRGWEGGVCTVVVKHSWLLREGRELCIYKEEGWGALPSLPLLVNL